MKVQQRRWAAHAVICALCLGAVLAVTVRQSGLRPRIAAQLGWPETIASANASANTSASVSVSVSVSFNAIHRAAPVATTARARTSGALLFNDTEQGRIVHPELYKLGFSRVSQANQSLPSAFPPALAPRPGLPPCRRPGSKTLAELLSRPASAIPYKRPRPGGLWAPADCWPPLSRTAVLVPYRNRSRNLDLFVPYMHSFLQHQGIAYGIFVVEQANLKLFNRAKLLNVGFKTAQRFGQFDCFVFQDADKVPENVANLFDCANAPKLMLSEIRPQLGPVRYNKGRFYHNFFGACVAITKAAFERVNGNSNRYYGWGREDDELAARMNLRGLRLHYPRGPDARFVNLHHAHDIVSNSMPWPFAHMVRRTMDQDGLNSLTYGDRGIFLHDLFTLIRADV